MQPLDHAVAPRFDGAAALSFLQALGAEPSAVHYRAIHWDKNHEPKGERAVHLAPTFQPRGARLEQLQQAGYRLYWLPNGGPNDADVKACSFLFVEWDEQPMEWQVGAWQALGLPEPTVLLATGGKSVHAYWRLSEPITPERWRPLIQRLIAYCKSDPTCKNPSRLMRLAGSSYIHKSDDLGPDGQSIGGSLGAHPARMIRHSPAAIYSADVFEERLPELPKPEPPAPAPAPAAPTRSAAADQPRTYEELERLVSSYPQILAKNGQREEALRLVCGLARCMELIGKGKLDAIALASRYHPQAADTFEQVDRWKFDQFDAGSFIKQCKGAGVDVKRHDIPKPPPPTPPLNGEQFIPPDAPVKPAAADPWQTEPLDDEDAAAARSDLLAELQSFRDAGELAAVVTPQLLFPPDTATKLLSYAEEQQLPVRGFYLPIFTTVASIIGNRAHCVPRSGDEVRGIAVLWGMSIGGVSAGKSPITAPAIERPLVAWHAAEREKHEAAIKEWNRGKAKAEEAEKRRRNGDDAGGSEDPVGDFLAENPQPERRYIISTDTTIEKLEINLLSAETPGHLSFHDELSGWFANLCRERGGKSDRPKWLSIGSGSSLMTDRVNRTEVLIQNPRCSLFGNLQPARIAGLWEADVKACQGVPDADGLWARFHMVQLPEWDYRYRPTTVHLTPVLSSLYKAIDATAARLPMPAPGKSCEILLAEDAIPLWTQWVDDLLEMRRARTLQEDKGYIIKLRGTTLTLALLIHAIRCGASGIRMDGPISADTLMAAISFAGMLIVERDRVLCAVRDADATGKVKELLARGQEWRRANGPIPVPLDQLRKWCLPQKRMKAAERRAWLEQVVSDAPDMGELREVQRSLQWLPPA
jgi:hypothetical protein